MNRRYLGFLLLVLSAALLAVSVILMKTIPQVTNLAPKDVAIWRFTVAAPVLWLVSLLRRTSATSQPTRPIRFLLLGVVYAIASFSASFALDRLSSSLYVIIVFLYPSMVVLYSIFTGRSVPRLVWFGLPLTLIGLFLVAYDFDAKLSMDLVGFIITLMNAVVMAAYLILSEKFFRNGGDKLTGTNWVMTGAMGAGLIMVLFLGFHFPDSLYGWILVLTFGIVATMLPILAMNIGLQYIGAARGSVVITLQPVLTVLLSTLFLHERLSPQQWVGGLLVIAAVVILQLSGDRVGHKEPVPSP